MSLKDILGFDPAVQCHPLSLVLCLVPNTCFLFHFLSRLSSLAHSHPLFTCLFLFLPFSFPLSLPLSPRHRFYVCLPDGGRKRSRKFICRDVAPRTAKHEWYIYMAPREKPGEMDLLGKGLSSVTPEGWRGKGRGGNAKCIFWKELANPLSKPRGSSSTVFALIRLRWILPSRAFGRGWKMCDVSLNATYFDAQQIPVVTYTS